MKELGPRRGGASLAPPDLPMVYMVTKGLSRPFSVLTDAEFDADYKRFRIHL